MTARFTAHAPTLARFRSLLHTIGNTPVVRIRNLAPAHVQLYGEAGGLQPDAAR
jgi:hypothetical protein